jgi:hypothetical protein
VKVSERRACETDACRDVVSVINISVDTKIRVTGEVRESPHLVTRGARSARIAAKRALCRTPVVAAL